MERTEEQKKIDSWIAENINIEALDKNIKMMLSEYPRFKVFDGVEVLRAIELAYLDITPEEQYDPHVWTIVAERALAVLEPDKDKLFTVAFNDYTDYVKEMTVGYKWLRCNLDTNTEKDCLRLGLYDYIDRDVTIEGDEVYCTITRIN